MENCIVNNRANGAYPHRSGEMESPPATIDGTEAVQRLRELEKKTRSLQVKPVRRQPSRVTSASVKPESDDPLEEMKLLRQAEKRKKSIQPSKSLSVAMTVDASGIESDPMVALKRERQVNKRMQSVSPSQGGENEDAQDQMGDLHPVKPFSRKESKIPQNSKPPSSDDNLLCELKRDHEDSRKSRKFKKKKSRKSKKDRAEIIPDGSQDLEESILMDDTLSGSMLGRKEAEPNSDESSNRLQQNEDHSSLSVELFDRKESKVVANISSIEGRKESVGSSFPVKPVVGKESNIPPKTASKEVLHDDHVGTTLPVKPFVRKKSKIPANTASGEFQGMEHIGSALPMKALGRKESKVSPNKAFCEFQGEERAGSSLPVKPFCRKESKVPPNTGQIERTGNDDGSSYPVKAFSRKESKVPPNTMSGELRLEVENRAGTSLPVNAFRRIESKTEERFISKTSPPKRSDRRSLTPGTTRGDNRRQGHSLMSQMFSRRAMKDEVNEKEDTANEKIQQINPGFFKSFMSMQRRRRHSAEKKKEDC